MTTGSAAFQGLRERLSAYDATDLVAGCGALQLMVRNANRLTRLEVAASVSASLSARGSSKMSGRKWKEWINGAPLSRFAYLEDSYEELFTTQVAFVGGGYTVFSGLASQAVRIQECLALVMIEPELGLTDESFRAWCRDLILAVLRTSDLVARRAGLGRAEFVPESTRRDIVIPAQAEFDRLKAAVALDNTTLDNLLANLGPRSLDPLVAELGEDVPDFDDPGQGWQATLLQHPLIRTSAGIVVASVGNLLPALRHAVILEAEARGLRDSLATAIAAAEAFYVERAMFLLDARRCDVLPPSLPHGVLGQTWFRKGDTDLFLNAVLLSDDLSQYGRDSLFGGLPATTFDLESHLRECSRTLHDKREGCSVLHVVVLGGIGRSGAAFFSEAPNGDRLIPVSVGDLQHMSLLEDVNSISLWKYVGAGDRVRDRTRVLCFSPLDELACYLDHASSYYLSDGRLPTTLNIVSGYSKQLVEKVVDTIDPHWALFPDNRFTDVALRRSDRRIPLYFAPNAMDRSHLLVEGQLIPIWITASEQATGSHRQVLDAFIEMLAYWIWQFASVIEPEISFIASRGFPSLGLSVALDQPHVWVTGDVPSGAPTEVVCSLGHRQFIDLLIPSGLIPILDSGTNEAERRVVKDVLAGIATLGVSLGMNPREAIVGPELDAAIDRIAPLGHKKALMLMSQPRRVAMQRTPNMDRVRTVQPADEAELLDARGNFLRSQGIPPGAIGPGDRTKVLNNCVKFFFDQLAETFKGLDQVSTLKKLVSQNEALLFETAIHETQLPTRVACFLDAIPEAVEKWREEQQRLVRASRAIRFLIEYLVAQPSDGSAELSLLTYDRLLALSALVLDDGTHSDAIFYQLSDTELSILESGRLGASRAAFDEAQTRFLGDLTRADLQRRDRAYEEWWDRSAMEGSPPEWLDEINEVTRVEFGASIQEIAEFVHTVVALGDNLPGEAKTLSRTELLDATEERLPRDRAEIERVLELLTLMPREEFFPAGKAQEVYPWRYNRSLSYVRRPFLLVEDPAGDQVVWGSRQIDSAGSNLADLCYGGRLKASSKPMKEFLSHTRNRTAEEFNDEVAAVLDAPPTIVRTRVKKFGRLRMERAPGQEIGDVDVLEVDPVRRRVRVIETKDFQLARTPAEMHNELVNLLVGTAVEPSAVAHTLERAAWISSNLPLVLESVGVSSSGQWAVTPLIVVDETLMTPYLRGSPVDVISIDALRDETAASAG